MNYLNQAERVENLVEKYGSPLFVYREEDLIQQYHLLSKSLGGLELFYSMKANPNPFICNFFCKKGLGIEVASKNEMVIALKSGFKPDRIFFTAPSKTEEEIEYAIDNNILAINIDNTSEYERVKRLAKIKGKKVKVTFRVYQNFENKNIQNVGSNMTSKTAQFGLSSEEIINILKNNVDDHLEFYGIHTYQGSQIYNLNIYEKSWEQLIELCKSIEHLDKKVSFIGLGGGFGYDVFNQKQFDLELFSKILNRFIDNNSSFLQNKILMMESGNFLTAKSGYYLTRVEYVKERNDGYYAFVNGGTHNIEGDSRFSRAFHGARPFYNIQERNGDKVSFTVLGKLLSPNDVLVYQTTCYPIKEGDILVFPNSGAYSLTSSRLQFLSHTEPVELGLSIEGEISQTRFAKDPILNYNFSFLN